MLSGRDVVVLVTADHGESFGENDRWFVHRHSTTPEIAHVPLMLRAPGLAPGRRTEVASHVDVMPTLLELAGLAPTPGSSGIAWGPHLRDGSPGPQRTVYCDAGRELSAYRGTSFVRVLGADGAWQPSGADPQALVWTRYQWPGGARFTRSGEPAPLEDEIRRYLEHATPMQRPGLPDGGEEALRALGYVD